MTNRCRIHAMLFIILLILVYGCASETASDKYVEFLETVVSILENDKIDTDKKGADIRDFVVKNKAEIEKTVAELAAMTPKDTEPIVPKVRNGVNRVLETIQALAQNNPEVAEDATLIDALRTLKVIGE